jgi:alpha-1,3-rhamnosyl/mannosyltransferase
LPDDVRTPYLLYVGTLEPRKHVDDLADAFLAVAPPEWRLVLAGARGWLGRDAAVRLDAATSSGRVVELGRVGDDVLAGLLAHAEAFAYPSSYEGFGLPVAEAMAGGVPVLTTSASALAELAGDAAVVVDLDRADAYGTGLRAALQSLMTDATLRARLAEAGRARVAGLSWDATADAVWSAVTR